MTSSNPGDLVVLFDGDGINVALLHVNLNPEAQDEAFQIAEELKNAPHKELYQEVLERYSLDEGNLVLKLNSLEEAANRLVEHYQGRVEKRPDYLHRVLEMLCLRARYLQLTTFPKVFLGRMPATSNSN